MRRALVFIAFFAVPAGARVLMTQEQALASAFPAGSRVVRQTFFLTAPQISAAKKESGVDFQDQLIVRYAGYAGDRLLGYAYFDAHRVRTMPETVMIVVTPDATVDRVDILSFEEPMDYFPKRRWLDQLLHHKVDRDLSLQGAIRPISGASLTGQAIVNATRKILAIHNALAGGPPK